MKKWINHIFSLLLIPVFIFSTGGTVIFQHYCKAQDANYYGISGFVNQDHCCTPAEISSSNTPGAQVKTAENCCSHQSIHLKTESFPDNPSLIITKISQTHAALPVGHADELISDYLQWDDTPLYYLSPPSIPNYQSVLCIFRL